MKKQRLRRPCYWMIFTADRCREEGKWRLENDIVRYMAWCDRHKPSKAVRIEDKDDGKS